MFLRPNETEKWPNGVAKVAICDRRLALTIRSIEPNGQNKPYEFLAETTIVFDKSLFHNNIGRKCTKLKNNSFIRIINSSVEEIRLWRVKKSLYTYNFLDYNAIIKPIDINNTKAILNKLIFLYARPSFTVRLQIWNLTAKLLFLKFNDLLS